MVFWTDKLRFSDVTFVNSGGVCEAKISATVLGQSLQNRSSRRQNCIGLVTLVGKREMKLKAFVMAQCFYFSTFSFDQKKNAHEF
jgi:hypothetical protein